MKTATRPRWPNFHDELAVVSNCICSNPQNNGPTFELPLQQILSDELRDLKVSKGLPVSKRIEKSSDLS
jgi:hypothetical protein